jgi:hypothetical protein
MVDATRGWQVRLLLVLLLGALFGAWWATTTGPAATARHRRAMARERRRPHHDDTRRDRPHAMLAAPRLSGNPAKRARIAAWVAEWDARDLAHR